MSDHINRRKFILLIISFFSGVFFPSETFAETKSVKNNLKKKAPPKKPATPNSKTPTPAMKNPTQSSPTPLQNPVRKYVPPQVAFVEKLPLGAIPITLAGKNLLLTDIPIGGSILGKYTRPARNLTTLLTRKEETVVFAFQPICPHQGGAVDISGKIFLCQRHGLTFDPTTGQVKNNEDSERYDTPRLNSDNVIIFENAFYIYS